MKQWHIETAIFVVAAVGAFVLAYSLAQTVGLHPLVVPPPDERHTHVLVAVGAAVFVAVVDTLVLLAIWRKHRRQASAAAMDRGPSLLR